MAHLETHPMLGGYLLDELRHQRERRVRHAHVQRTPRPTRDRRDGSRVIRALPMRVRGVLRA
jgi:hypothetical protein